MDIEKLRASLAKADDEKRYSIHRQYKKILCDIAGIKDVNGAIPDSLTYKQIARFFCPDCQEKQKVIADYILCTVNYFYSDKPIYSDHFSVNDINELAKELNIVIPDYVLWWINGHRPKNIVLPESHPPSGIEQSNEVISYQHEIKANEPSQIMQSNNDCSYSGLLNIPKRIDDWFPVIDDMTKAFYNEYGKMPNAIQAWSQLCTKPPHGYGVSIGKGRLKDCLTIQSGERLSNRSFNDRWKRYTKNKTQ